MPGGELRLVLLLLTPGNVADVHSFGAERVLWPHSIPCAMLRGSYTFIAHRLLVSGWLAAAVINSRISWTTETFCRWSKVEDLHCGRSRMRHHRPCTQQPFDLPTEGELTRNVLHCNVTSLGEVWTYCQTLKQGRCLFSHQSWPQYVKDQYCFFLLNY